MSKIKIKRGDIIEVIAGNDKGKTGKALMVLKVQMLLKSTVNNLKRLWTVSLVVMVVMVK